mmetsp:Transcript_14228/g.27696  ORF Transcript_14228/g.27696 Transcript_14228/m.27696 type:complete len:100 (-) Transcript_14228:228-527(-)
MGRMQFRRMGSSGLEPNANDEINPSHYTPKRRNSWANVNDSTTTPSIVDSTNRRYSVGGSTIIGGSSHSSGKSPLGKSWKSKLFFGLLCKPKFKKPIRD